MKKIIIVAVLFMIALLHLTAESTKTPYWIYNDVSTSEKYYISAYAKMSKKQNSIKKAQIEARNLLAEHINTVVSEIVETYSSEFSVDDETQIVDTFLSISKQYSQATIRGAKQEEMWDSPDGGVWILMSVPTAEIENALNSAVDETWKTGDISSFENAKRMMNEAIDKYFGEKNEEKVEE